jgi:hypothetical protein
MIDLHGGDLAAVRILLYKNFPEYHVLGHRVGIRPPNLLDIVEVRRHSENLRF